MKILPDTSSNELVYLPITALKPFNNNARTHSPKQVRQIAKSIEQFGFINPVLIDAQHRIMAGHGRVEAAKLLGLSEVPTLRFDHLSETQMRAYVLADNKIAENAGWNPDMLVIEFQALALQMPEFDLDITGFEMAEIDLMIDGDTNNQIDPADDIPEPLEHAVAKSGDIWQCGNHRLLCGSALDKDAYMHLLQQDLVRAVITDPPYNVRIDRHVCGNGKIKHREFAMAAGEMDTNEFEEFLDTFLDFSAEYCLDGALLYVCMDWRHIRELLNVGLRRNFTLHNICVWNKDNGGMGSMYRSKHEFVTVFKHGSAPHINNIELGKYGRYRTNVWDYAGVNSFAGSQDDLALHPTVKPVRMIADTIKDCTKRSDIVLDPFAGSGTTMIAAEKSGRISRCIELDPLYCDTIIRRWQDYTGKEAVHSESGKTFDQTAEEGGAL